MNYICVLSCVCLCLCVCVCACVCACVRACVCVCFGVRIMSEDYLCLLVCNKYGGNKEFHKHALNWCLYLWMRVCTCLHMCRIVSISSCGHSHPSSIAMRYLQRKCIMCDPNWNKGHYYDGVYPKTGMKLARWGQRERERVCVCERERRGGWEREGSVTPPSRTRDATVIEYSHGRDWIWQEGDKKKLKTSICMWERECVCLYVCVRLYLWYFCSCDFLTVCMLLKVVCLLLLSACFLKLLC